jgi:hypothetical protein
VDAQSSRATNGFVWQTVAALGRGNFLFNCPVQNTNGQQLDGIEWDPQTQVDSTQLTSAFGVSLRAGLLAVCLLALIACFL